MDSGRCRRCGRAFTAGEVTGLGILRPRPALAGGPVVEFPCPACRTVNRLVPHGNGRFAPPGQPPPPPPTDVEKRVPWRKDKDKEEDVEPPPPAPRASTHDPSAAPSSGSTPPPPSAREVPPPPSPGPEKASPRPPPKIPPPMPTPDSPPRDALEALALLGLPAGASRREIERAFRQRALLCHPDKVAHLDPDFVALAQRKFVQLQAARDLLLGG